MPKPSEASRLAESRWWSAAPCRRGVVALATGLLMGALWLQGCAAGRASPGAAPANVQGPSMPPVALPSPTPARMQPNPAAPATTVPTQAQPTPAASGVLASIDDVQRIGPVEAKALLDRGAAVLYDVRSAEMYQAKHAAGAVSLPADQIENLAGSLPKGKTLIFYCT